ncbi:MAG: hypothetical protein AB8B94_00295 [Hyphomicrobiales bacterium]
MISQANTDALSVSPTTNSSGLIPVAAILVLGFAIGFAISEIRHGETYVAEGSTTSQSPLITNDWHGNVQRRDHY